jgi:putative hydrolase of the HAD superfamily
MTDHHTNPSPPIRLVVFDLGNVMIHLAHGWEGACALAEVPYRPFALTPEQQQQRRELGQAFERGAITPEAFYAGMHQALGGCYTVPEIRAVYQAIIADEIPGIYDTVAALKAAGLRTACLSNTCAPHWIDLTNPARYPGIGLLDARHASHLLGAMKPEPEIYARFEEAMGMAGEGILFFDDLADNIAAARACGWHAQQIVAGCSPVEQMQAIFVSYGIRISDAVRG